MLLTNNRCYVQMHDVEVWEWQVGFLLTHVSYWYLIFVMAKEDFVEDLMLAIDDELFDRQA